MPITARPCAAVFLIRTSSPLSRSHGQATPREPWVFSEKTQAAFLKINKLRYRMLPYLYSVAWETHRTGLPMMRPMLLEFQEDFAARDIGTQYMLGEALLVAPYFDQKIHRVYLPEGSWLELNTLQRVRGGRWVAADKSFDTIPLYLRPDHAVPLFDEAPLHIGEKNFSGYDLILNLTDRREQHFYDDGFDGSVRAVIADGIVTVETDLPVRKLRVYSDQPIREIRRQG